MNREKSRLTWRKSSYSGGSGSECVETAENDAMYVRDSKDPSGPHLTFSHDAWTAFLTAVKTDSFYRA